MKPWQTRWLHKTRVTTVGLHSRCRYTHIQTALYERQTGRTTCPLGHSKDNIRAAHFQQIENGARFHFSLPFPFSNHARHPQPSLFNVAQCTVEDSLRVASDTSRNTGEIHATDRLCSVHEIGPRFRRAAQTTTATLYHAVVYLLQLRHTAFHPTAFLPASVVH